MNARQQHRSAFQAALEDGRECSCRLSSAQCADEPCLLCTPDFLADHPCPAAYPSIYYISGETRVRLNGEETVLTQAVIEHGQCSCGVTGCVEDCDLCTATEETRCPRGRHVALASYEQSLRAGYITGELPCPHGGSSCSVADNRWYHGDCEPSPLAKSLMGAGVSGATFICAQHGAHPHNNVAGSKLVCARCPACLAENPDAVNAAHDYSDLMAPPKESAEVQLARHLDRLAEALGIVGAEDDIDMYEAVEGLHAEIDRLREVFGSVSYVLQVALNPNASSAAWASPAEQPWNGARKALELAQKEVGNAAGKR